MSGNYSEIVKNNYAILDMFKKLKDRETRVRSAAHDNQVKFYRAFKQNRIELDLKRGNFKVENDFVNAKMNAGILSTQDDDASGCNEKTLMTKPGYGKYDLDTGLNISKKIQVRSMAEAKQKGLKKNAYQMYKEKKENPLAKYPGPDSDAAFLNNVKGHDVDIKDRKKACSHINDGLGEIDTDTTLEKAQAKTGCSVDGIGQKPLTEEQKEALLSRKQQQEADEQQFRLIYEQQRLRNLEIQREYQMDEFSSMLPLVKELFSDKTDLHNDITHVKYMEMMENEEMAEQVVTCLRRRYQKDIIAFGHDQFKKLVRENQDRRYLFKLIKKQISFDQFTTRVICETRGVKYYCVEDLLEKGVSPHFFSNVSGVKKFLLAQHGVKRIEDIKVSDITFNCGQGKTVEDYFEDTAYDEISTPRIKKMIKEDLQVNKWKCNKRCLKSNFTIIDKQITNKNEKRIKEGELHANRQKFCKTSTFRLNIPVHPGNLEKSDQAEHEELLNNQTKYIKKLLKQNFSKYRNKNKSQTAQAENSEQIHQSFDQKSVSMLSSQQRPISGMSNPKFEAQSGLTSQIQPTEAANTKIHSRDASRVNSALQIQNLETQMSQPRPLSQHSQPTVVQSPVAQSESANVSKKKRESKISDKLKTRQDLLFIRLLQESGITVYSDPEIQMNLLYDWERDEYFKKLKKTVEVKKKKGPREILNPQFSTLEHKKLVNSQNFNGAIYKERLEEAISKKIGPKVLKKIKENYKEQLGASMLKIEVNTENDDEGPQQPLTQSIIASDHRTNVDQIVRITHEYLDSDLVRAQLTLSEEEKQVPEIRQVHQRVVSHIISEPGVLSLKQTEIRDGSSSKSPIQNSPMILEQNFKSYGKNSRENLVDIHVQPVFDESMTKTHRRELTGNDKSYIECLSPKSPPKLTQNIIIQQQVRHLAKVVSDQPSTGDGNFSNATVSQVASKQELSPTGLFQQQQVKQRLKSAAIGGRAVNVSNPLIHSIDPSFKIGILNHTINQSQIENFLDHNINVATSSQFGNRRWKNESVNFSQNRALAQKYKDKIAMQGKQMSLDIPIQKSDSAADSVNVSRHNKMVQKHARNMSAITSQSPKRCLGQGGKMGRFVLSSVNEHNIRQNFQRGSHTTMMDPQVRTSVNNSQNLSLTGALNQQQRQLYGNKLAYMRNAGVANSTNFAPQTQLRSPVGEDIVNIFGEGGWKDNTSMSTSANPMSHVAVNVSKTKNGRNSMVFVKSEDTHFSDKVRGPQRYRNNYKGQTLSSQDPQTLQSAIQGGFQQEKKIRPMSSAGGGFKIQSKDSNKSYRQRISRDFKQSQNRQSQEMQSNISHQDKNIPAGDKSEFIDLQNLKNLLSNTNSSDQKLIQYIKSIGFHVNDSNAVMQNISPSALGTITDSDFKNYIDFQRQCLKLQEEIQNQTATQNTIGSDGQKLVSQRNHEFNPKFLARNGDYMEASPSIFNKMLRHPVQLQTRELSKVNLASQRSVLKTQDREHPIASAHTDHQMQLEVGNNAQESLVNKTQSWVELTNQNMNGSQDDETHKHGTSHDASKTDLNNGSILMARQDEEEDVIVHVSSQPDLQEQDKMETEPMVPHFVNDLKNKYGDIDFTGQEQLMFNSLNFKHEQFDFGIQAQISQDKSIIEQKGRYAVKQSKATEKMLKKVTMQVGLSKNGSPQRISENQEVEFEETINQTIPTIKKPKFQPVLGFNLQKNTDKSQ